MGGTKTSCDMYRIAVNGEYATICLAEWTRTMRDKLEKRIFGGEILVHSSYGSYCHTWTACAVPFKQFLTRITFDSFMAKCLGNDYMVFDGAASVEQVKQAIIRQRDDEELAAEFASELLDELEAAREIAEGSEDAFHIALADLCNDDTIGSSGDYVVRKPSCQAQGFWRELWPEFISMLNTEREQENQSIVASAA